LPTLLVTFGADARSDSAAAEAVKATHKPQDNQYDQNETKNATETSAPISAVCVITAATAKQQNQNYNYQDRSHMLVFRSWLRNPGHLHHA
jgi:hypothetical protein